ncbi:hypothetical protein, partial [Oceanicoccus sp.]|uniref:hypothetical protein n=1 Tax=Oceanicoccus sp. TaxID=2691044 RepID=UPI00262EBF27
HITRTYQWTPMPATKPFVAPEQPNLIPASPRHSREGGNPDCMFMLLFPLKRKLTALDSRLRGNDGGLRE